MEFVDRHIGPDQQLGLPAAFSDPSLRVKAHLHVAVLVQLNGCAMRLGSPVFGFPWGHACLPSALPWASNACMCAALVVK